MMTAQAGQSRGRGSLLVLALFAGATCAHEHSGTAAEQVTNHSEHEHHECPEICSDCGHKIASPPGCEEASYWGGCWPENYADPKLVHHSLSDVDMDHKDSMWTKLFAMVLVCTFVWEGLTEHFEHHWKGTFKARLLESFLAEIAMVGVITLCMMFYQNAGSADIEHMTHLTFEYVHLQIFIAAAILKTLQTYLAFRYVCLDDCAWRIASTASHGHAVDELIERAQTKRCGCMKRKSLLNDGGCASGRLLWWEAGSHFPMMSSEPKATYTIYRQIFLDVHLKFAPQKDSFDYASYVVRSLEEYVSEEAETRKATWFLSLAVYLLLCGFLQPMLSRAYGAFVWIPLVWNHLGNWAQLLGLHEQLLVDAGLGGGTDAKQRWVDGISRRCTGSKRLLHVDSAPPPDHRSTTVSSMDTDSQGDTSSYHNPLERASSSSSGYHVDHASELPSAADGGSLDSQIHDMVPGALHAGVNFKRMRERLSPRGLENFMFKESIRVTNLIALLHFATYLMDRCFKYTRYDLFNESALVLMCHVAEVGSFLFIIAYAAPRINALASLLDSTLYCQHESLEWVLKREERFEHMINMVRAKVDERFAHTEGGVRAKADAMFKLIDKDHSVTVDREELRAGFTSLGCCFDHAEWELLMAILDKNGDDSIDQKEFMSLFEDSVDSLQRQVSAVSITGDRKRGNISSGGELDLELMG